MDSAPHIETTLVDEVFSRIPSSVNCDMLTISSIENAILLLHRMQTKVSGSSAYCCSMHWLNSTLLLLNFAISCNGKGGDHHLAEYHI
jgi:hypothetical protein